MTTKRQSVCVVKLVKIGIGLVNINFEIYVFVATNANVFNFNMQADYYGLSELTCKKFAKDSLNMHQKFD